MDDTSSVTFFDAEGTVGSTNNKGVNILANLQWSFPSISLFFYIPFAGVITEAVAVGSLLTGDGELNAAVFHSL
jgi:hypothetical protein